MFDRNNRCWALRRVWLHFSSAIRDDLHIGCRLNNEYSTNCIRLCTSVFTGMHSVSDWGVRTYVCVQVSLRKCTVYLTEACEQEQPLQIELIFTQRVVQNYCTTIDECNFRLTLLRRACTHNLKQFISVNPRRLEHWASLLVDWKQLYSNWSWCTFCNLRYSQSNW